MYLSRHQTFKAIASPENLTAIGEAFMGYHEDTCSAIVLQVWKSDEEKEGDERFEQVYDK